MDTFDKAILLINSVCGELEMGTKHYNKAGGLLTTPLEIIETMREEGGVTMEPVKSRQGIFRMLNEGNNDQTA